MAAEFEHISTEPVFPEHANHYGTLFGGQALSMMARAAWVAAVTRIGGAVVMARVDGVEFLAPVPVGDLLRLSAALTMTGGARMRVDVLGEAGPPGGALRAVLRGSFEMVAVDGRGRPRRIAHETAALPPDEQPEG